MIKLFWSRLEKEPMELSGELSPEIFDLRANEVFSAPHPLKYKLNAVLTAGGIVVRGRAETVVEGLCGRCLDKVSQKVECEYTLYFDEIKEEELDITDDIREELMLNFPMNLYCSDDCKGICPYCKANLNREKCRCTKSNDTAKMPSVWDKLDELSAHSELKNNPKSTR